MNISRFFVDRPIFAAVLSIIIFAIGLISIPNLPVSEYPEVVPPSVVVRTVYPGANPKEIIFTSGATESNNMAIKGVANFYKGRKSHVITTQTDHKCVLDSCRYLEQQGWDVTYLPVKSNGLIDLDELKAAIRPETAVVSVMAVNNEIGVIQPLKEIGEICRANKVFFHTDAAQAVGKIPIDVEDMKIDLLSISGHKIYGPKGVGAIYIRRRPRVRMEPLISGGGQERGLRSGTLAPALCVGLGKACAVAVEEMEYDRAHVEMLSKRLIDGIRAKCEHIQLNGDADARYPGNVNMSFAYVEGESLLMGLKEIAVSSGSACTSASLEPSYVLRALGVDEEMAHTSIRYGLGRFTTIEEVDKAIEEAKAALMRRGGFAHCEKIAPHFCPGRSNGSLGLNAKGPLGRPGALRVGLLPG